MWLSPAAVPQAEGAQSGGGWQWSEAARRGPAGDLGDHHRDQRRRTGSYYINLHVTSLCQDNRVARSYMYVLSTIYYRVVEEHEFYMYEKLKKN